MNNIINKMGTLINYNGKWTTELGKNVVIQKLCSNNNYISVRQSIISLAMFCTSRLHFFCISQRFNRIHEHLCSWLATNNQHKKSSWWRCLRRNVLHQFHYAVLAVQLVHVLVAKHDITCCLIQICKVLCLVT